MNKLTLAAALGALTIVAAPAFAYHDDDDGYRYRDRYVQYNRHDYNRYDPNDGYSYAEVLSSRPIYRQVRVAQPRQECWDERVVYQDRPQPAIGPGTIIGGIIGGVVGNQFGGGNGRAVATAAGAVIGASVGAQQDAYAYSRYNRGGYEHVGYQQRCRTTEDVSYQNRIDGYDVTYRYHDRVYRTQLPYDPGRRLAVDVDVRPIRE